MELELGGRRAGVFSVSPPAVAPTLFKELGVRMAVDMLRRALSRAGDEAWTVEAHEHTFALTFHLPMPDVHSNPPRGF